MLQTDLAYSLPTGILEKSGTNTERGIKHVRQEKGRTMGFFQPGEDKPI